MKPWHKADGFTMGSRLLFPSVRRLMYSAKPTLWPKATILPAPVPCVSYSQGKAADRLCVCLSAGRSLHATDEKPCQLVAVSVVHFKGASKVSDRLTPHLRLCAKAPVNNTRSMAWHFVSAFHHETAQYAWHTQMMFLTEHQTLACL